MFSSIRARLTGFYLLLLLALFTLLGILLFFSLHRIVYRSIDAGLLVQARALAASIEPGGHDENLNFSDEVMQEYGSPHSGHFFQIRNAEGLTLKKSSSMNDVDFPIPKAGSIQRYMTVLLKGKPVRFVNFYFSPESETGAQKPVIIIQCGQVIDRELDLLHGFTAVLAGSVFLFLCVSGLAGIVLARKALEPVNTMSRTIDLISEMNLSERIDASSDPEELKRIAESFNRTLERLEKSFERQKHFVADASHELRTPLAVILAHSDVMLRKKHTVAEYEEAVTAIRDAAAMMSAIVEKLLTLARMTSDRTELKFEQVALDDIIRQGVKLLSPLAEEKAVGVELFIPESVTVRGDREALMELFVNLIDNSIKYNVAGGHVKISFRQENGYAVIEILDTGIGIASEEIEAVFDRFYRVDKARGGKAVGLGLSISREIARLHQGRIELRSKTGSGTVALIYLPLQSL